MRLLELFIEERRGLICSVFEDTRIRAIEAGP